MSIVNVNYEDLIRFKQTLDNNAAQFEQIRDQIQTTITRITDSEWQDAKSEQFKATYQGSFKEITELVVLMRGFSGYLLQKIEILQQYHQTNINF